MCDTTQRKGRALCNCGHIRAALLDDIVAQAIKERYGSEVARKRYVDILTASMSRQEEAIQSELGEVENALQALEPKRKRLRAMLLDGQISGEDYHSFVQDIQGDAHQLEQRKARLTEALVGVRANQAQREEMLAQMARLDAWDTLDPMERKALVRHFIDKIEVYKPKRGDVLECVITWCAGGAGEPEHAVALAPHTVQRRNLG